MSKKASNITKQYGGICSSCGQVAPTATVGSMHSSCRGYVVDYDFKDEKLNSYGAHSPMCADGATAEHPRPGTWISEPELISRRAENLERHIEKARRRVLMTSLFGPDGKFVGLDVTDGLGTPVTYNGGRWVPSGAACGA